MTRSRTRPLLFALIVAVTVRGAYGVPSAATAYLKAVACCARCHHACALAGAMRCCGAQTRDEVATSASALGKSLKPCIVAHPVAEFARHAKLVVSRDEVTPRHERAARLFLVDRSLRL